VHSGAPGKATAVLLHGAGKGGMDRLLPLPGEFAGRGCRALAFDFSGHGESTGTPAEPSLRRRFEQVVRVLDAQAPDGPPVLVGFSMSGQTVADLLRRRSRRAPTAPASNSPEPSTGWACGSATTRRTGGSS
jgi:pimeloyl-ACP methyl ester carboxylesterase